MANDSSDPLLLIGAGPVGLGVARALAERGIAYDHVDANSAVGGLWHRGAYEGAHIISSRRTTAFPEFPMPDAYPDFPSREQMFDYLNAYADHFRLRERLQLDTRVESVRPVENDRWRVRVAREGRSEEWDTKGVIVCNGHHWDPVMPEVPGDFAGKLIHSSDYQSPDDLRGKRVLVIGAGNSACDIASEAARSGESADLSVRDGAWFLPKTLFGVPIAELARPWVPTGVAIAFLRALLWVSVGPYARYGLPHPEHRLFDKHPTISSEVLHYLKHGRIVTRGAIERFAGPEVVFTDGTSAEYDLVVAATGFRLSYPMFPEGLVPVHGSTVACYGGSMLPEYRHLYLFGWSQPRFGFGPLVSPAADLLARFIELQDEISQPLGYVLKELRQPVATTHLLDPGDTLRDIRRGQRSVPLLRFAARHWVGRGNESNPVWPAHVGAPS